MLLKIFWQENGAAGSMTEGGMRWGTPFRVKQLISVGVIRGEIVEK